MNSESAENIQPIGGDNAPSSSSPRIRNRYLKRIGVGAGSGGEDDELPLLNDD